MSSEPERASLGTPVNSADAGSRALSAHVRRLHNGLNLLLSDLERQQFIHCLNVYHAKRNVFDLVQTLKVILSTPSKRRLLPLLRLAIPRSDQLLFDQYTSEGLYLTADLLPGGGGGDDGADDGLGDDGDSALLKYVSSIQEQEEQQEQQEEEEEEEEQQQPPRSAELLAAGAAPLWDARRVTLTRARSHEGLGFSIRGGAEHGVGIYVSLVEPDSSAEREGLRVGDQILSVNELSFDRVTHVDAVKVLKGCGTLAMTVCSLGRLPGGRVTNRLYSWVDPQGRSVSPPPDPGEAGRLLEERTVSLRMDEGRSLGLMIRGGAEYGLGIYVTGVDPGSAAHAGALKVGEQILEVNGQSFVVISHDEAVHILKTGRRLLVKTFIRQSHARARKAVHRYGVGPPGLEQQAFLLLTEAERRTMAYYLQEYQEGHIAVQALVMALFELFNTHAKLSMLAEVRSLVALQDLEMFDRLVVHDREVHHAWPGDPGAAPQCPCSLPAPQLHHPGHSISVLDQAPRASSRLSRAELLQKPSARVLLPGPDLDAANRPCSDSAYQASLSGLQLPCQSPLLLRQAQQQLYPQARPASGHHSCPLLPQPRPAVRADSASRLPSRSSSCDKSSIFSKSASSSKAASPLASPHLSPCPSPCPSLIIATAPRCGAERPCSPALTHRVMVADANRLSADCRAQQRGGTLSQLSDSGQTLSEDSGVDIAEAGALIRDGSPRPIRTQQGRADHAGAHVAPPGPPRPQAFSSHPVLLAPTTTLVQVVKSASTLGIAIEGGANTRQPLPRIVTIQKGGSAHQCGQLKVGHIILEVNGISLRGRQHKEAATIIAEAFKTKEKNHVDFLVAEPGL